MRGTSGVDKTTPPRDASSAKPPEGQRFDDKPAELRLKPAPSIEDLHDVALQAVLDLSTFKDIATLRKASKKMRDYLDAYLKGAPQAQKRMEEARDVWLHAKESFFTPKWLTEKKHLVAVAELDTVIQTLEAVTAGRKARSDKSKEGTQVAVDAAAVRRQEAAERRQAAEVEAKDAATLLRLREQARSRELTPEAISHALTGGDKNSLRVVVKAVELLQQLGRDAEAELLLRNRLRIVPLGIMRGNLDTTYNNYPREQLAQMVLRRGLDHVDEALGIAPHHASLCWELLHLLDGDGTTAYDDQLHGFAATNKSLTKGERPAEAGAMEAVVERLRLKRWPLFASHSEKAGANAFFANPAVGGNNAKVFAEHAVSELREAINELGYLHADVLSIIQSPLVRAMRGVQQWDDLVEEVQRKRDVLKEIKFASPQLLDAVLDIGSHQVAANFEGDAQLFIDKLGLVQQGLIAPDISGAFLRKIGEYHSAEILLRLGKHPGCLDEVNEELALLLLETGRVQEARGVVDSISGHSPSVAKLQLLILDKNFRAAKDEVNKLPIRDQACWMAIICDKQPDLGSSEEWMKRVYAHSELALIKAGDVPAAIAELKKSIKARGILNEHLWFVLQSPLMKAVREHPEGKAVYEEVKEARRQRLHRPSPSLLKQIGPPGPPTTP